MLFHTMLALNGIPAHELPLRLKSFHSDIRVAKPFYAIGSEEIFMEAAAYLTVRGCHDTTPIPDLVLEKGENGIVGNYFGIVIRSDVFTPRELRNSENVPPNALEYRAFGEK